MGDTSNIKPFKAKEDQVKVLHSRVGLELPKDPLEHIRRRLREEVSRNRNVKMAMPTLWSAPTRLYGYILTKLRG